MFEYVILVLIVIIIMQFISQTDYFSGNIASDEFPDKEIIKDNNYLNNLYREQNISDSIMMNTDSNVNNYYQDDIDYDNKRQYQLLDGDIDYEKYYNMYKHQLNCPCPNSKEIGFDNCQNDLDVFKLGNTALKNNKNKSCVSCNFEKDIGAVLTQEQQKIDMNMVKKNILVNNNVEKFAEYKEFVNQNSNQFETQVDKLAQCRTGETCELSKFGETIWDAYDNLLSNDFTKYQTRTNPDILTGVSNDMAMMNKYERVPSIDYNIDKQL